MAEFYAPHDDPNSNADELAAVDAVINGLEIGDLSPLMAYLLGDYPVCRWVRDEIAGAIEVKSLKFGRASKSGKRDEQRIARLQAGAFVFVRSRRNPEYSLDGLYKEAAGRLGVSERTAERSYREFMDLGDAADHDLLSENGFHLLRFRAFKQMCADLDLDWASETLRMQERQ